MDISENESWNYIESLAHFAEGKAHSPLFIVFSPLLLTLLNRWHSWARPFRIKHSITVPSTVCPWFCWWFL